MIPPSALQSGLLQVIVFIVKLSSSEEKSYKLQKAWHHCTIFLIFFSVYLALKYQLYCDLVFSTTFP